jgi:hypothetical protein
MATMSNKRINLVQFFKIQPFRVKVKLVALSLSALFVVGCATVKPVEIATNEGIMRSHEVSITRQTVLPGTPETVFNFITAEDVLPKILTRYGPLPAVIKTSENTGPWTVAGSARLIHLADGTTVREQVVRFEPTSFFAYRVWEFGNPIVRSLASGARGEWTFSSAPGGTLVTWKYTFTAKNSFATLPLSAITQILWRGYMDVCLENSKRLLGEK